MQLFLKKCDQIDRFLGKVSCERHSVRIFFSSVLLVLAAYIVEHCPSVEYTGGKGSG